MRIYRTMNSANAVIEVPSCSKVNQPSHPISTQQITPFHFCGVRLHMQVKFHRSYLTFDFIDNILKLCFRQKYLGGSTMKMSQTTSCLISDRFQSSKYKKENWEIQKNILKKYFYAWYGVHTPKFRRRHFDCINFMSVTIIE